MSFNGSIKCSLFVLLCFIACPIHAQKKKHAENRTTVKGAPNTPKTRTYITQSAEFPGGTIALNKYLSQNTHYPPIAREDNIQGTVILSFFITEEGKIEDIRVDRSLIEACNKEAIRVVKAMPDWKPAKYKGKAIRTLFELPIQFKIAD